ncbi:MAG TPA: hypothetical protein VIW78_10150 [Burkholderiales bacterium]
MTGDIRAFQIFYDEKTRASVDPDFEPLDNLINERPDWYEYWPIRNYLMQNRLDESAYYGFLSPNFGSKTGLAGKQVKDFVRQTGDADVITFSPFPCHAACFVNVFEHGEFFHRGLFDIASRFFRGMDSGAELDTLVTHSRNTVFSNFFLAKSKFWNLWKVVFDRLFESAETRTSPLYSLLNGELAYTKEGGESKLTQMKIFIMERAVSYLLATSKDLATKNFPPFKMPVSSNFNGHLPDIVVLDALKIAFSETGEPYFFQLFRELRDKAVASVWPGNLPWKPVGPPSG